MGRDFRFCVIGSVGLVCARFSAKSTLAAGVTAATTGTNALALGPLGG